ncbi:MAG TPA: acyl-CoA thioesterase [Rhabdochlamydiaceae bacterium]|nr:acyl-CoA thioesterase [Rhabdochlamydiaceae bacterium]
MGKSLPGKPVSVSAIHDQTSVVFPNDLNIYGTLFGGRLLELGDWICGVVAKRHSGKVSVTLAIDSVKFHAPAKAGDTLIFKASINRAWHTSMEIGLKVFAEDYKTMKRRHIFSAYFTFVALDDRLKPSDVPPVIPETEEEKRRYKEAEARRSHRLKQLK